MIWQLIEEDHIEQRLVYLNAAVVLNEAKLAKAVHKEADSRSGGTDHLGKCFLSNGWYEFLWFTRLAKFRHQKENARQSFFAGIEELIYQIGLSSHTASEQEFHENV